MTETISKNEREREILEELKEAINAMKFSSSIQQIVDIYALLEELAISRGLSKVQIDIRRNLEKQKL
jgi:hypothetical protein